MATSSVPNTMQAQVDFIVEILGLLDRGEITGAEIRERTQDVPAKERLGILALVELAEMLHELPAETEPSPQVKNPRYRKGTGMRAVSWSDCLWQPKALRS